MPLAGGNRGRRGRGKRETGWRAAAAAAVVAALLLTASIMMTIPLATSTVTPTAMPMRVVSIPPPDCCDTVLAPASDRTDKVVTDAEDTELADDLDETDEVGNATYVVASPAVINASLVAATVVEAVEVTETTKILLSLTLLSPAETMIPRRLAESAKPHVTEEKMQQPIARSFWTKNWK